MAAPVKNGADAPPRAAQSPATTTAVTLARVTPVRLVRRYKRFLADVLFDGSSTVTTVHCPNTGPMTGLLPALEPGVEDGGPGAPPTPGAQTLRAFVSTSASATRKYAHTLEAVVPEGPGDDGRTIVGVHSAAANRVVAALAAAGALDGEDGLGGVVAAAKGEVPYGRPPAGRGSGTPASRADFLFSLEGGREVVAEVKSVTLAGGGGGGGADGHAAGGGRVGLFPDTVSVRAARHAAELASVASSPPSSRSAAAIFLIQRGDCASFAPCHACDPEYGRALAAAVAAGVRVLALRASLAFVPDEAGGSEGALILTHGGRAAVDLEHGLADAAERGGVGPQKRARR